ncbi:MAG: DUF3943 domain-containing protein, partial [Chitinophagales bacterium]|nr:DUF3943 domain-containing protein [Chitinophagales bacterium]
MNIFYTRIFLTIFICNCVAGYTQPSFGNSKFVTAPGLFCDNIFYASASLALIPPAGFKDSLPRPGKDTLSLSHKNYLRNDDPEFNKKYSVLIPVFEVSATNFLIWSYYKFLFSAPYADISIARVKSNFSNGWEWDTDDFLTNFSLHPYTGSLYFNAARSNGYSFTESTPFVLGGRLMWELFMENSKPSYNDLINTTVSGIFLGEVLYRLSSSILDDRKTGGPRVLREVLATVVDPERGFNRLLQGKMKRVVNKEIYQKEPLSLSVAAGVNQPNGGAVHPMLKLDLTYGNPLEVRFRKPFDYFRLRTDLNIGSTSKVVNNVIGDGILFGKNIDSVHRMKVLIGGFQHYDYWNTDSFEIGTIGLGGGVITNTPVFKNASFQNELHIALVPLGGSNEKVVPASDTLMNLGLKYYSYSGGAEIKILSALNFKWGQLAAEY